MRKDEKVVQLYDVPGNVNAFFDSACALYGRHKAEEMNQFIWQESRKLVSPIEQLFLAAILITAEVNITPAVLGHIDPRSNVDDHCLIVQPQCEIDRYRIDFALAYHDKPVVCVELDGHQFHDKDERQRRHEKQRDRFLATRGFVVMHFTGTEVSQDPFVPALEAFIAATGLRDIAINPRDL